MKVRELLDSPEKWIQHASVINAQGHQTWNIDEGVRFCLSGALKRCYGDAYPRWAEVRTVIQADLGLCKCGCGSIAAWNDRPNTCYRDVKALVDRLDI